MAEKGNKVLDSKKPNWILWSVIAVVVVGLIIGGIFLVKALADTTEDDTDRITTFDSYDQLPYSYFLQDYVYIDPTVTTTTSSTTAETTEPVIEELADVYYLFIYDGTKSCTDYGCTSYFTEEVGYDGFIEEIKSVLDTIIAKGIQVYVADVSQTYYEYNGVTIDGTHVFTEAFDSTRKNGTDISIVAPALIKVTEVNNNVNNVRVYYSGVERLYNDIEIKVNAFEGWE